MIRSRSRGAWLPLLSGFAVAFAVAGCGGKPPTIAAVEWRLESRPADEGAYESLSAFAWVKAEDGIENIDEVWVVHDESAMGWRLTDSDWIKTPEGSDAWIGGSALAAPDFKPLPRGTWRMIALDASGQRAEREFSVLGSFPSRPTPSLTLSSGSLTASSSWPETLALAFDATGAQAGSVAAPAGSARLEDLFGTDAAGRANEVALYGYDPSQRMGAFSRRVSTR
ncbi:MAG: hypothetical protein Q8M76_14830 [Spirochaetaceae bacterium]|nr:hypothetical protein [Spirochaetaceae bacterium]